MKNYQFHRDKIGNFENWHENNKAIAEHLES